MNKALALTVVGLVAATAFTTTASASARKRGFMAMTSVDYTKAGPPVIHDNGVPDGRLCKIFWKTVYDPWIEDYRVAKVKRCI